MSFDSEKNNEDIFDIDFTVSFTDGDNSSNFTQRCWSERVC